MLTIIKRPRFTEKKVLLDPLLSENEIN